MIRMNKYIPIFLMISFSIARHLQKHQRLITVLESMDNGKPFRESRDADIPTMIRHFYHYAGWAQLADTEMAKWKSVGLYDNELKYIEK